MINKVDLPEKMKVTFGSQTRYIDTLDIIKLKQFKFLFKIIE